MSKKFTTKIQVPPDITSSNKYSELDSNVLPETPDKSSLFTTQKKTFQKLSLEIEELDITLFARQKTDFTVFLYRLICFATLGVVYLACRWFPQLKSKIKLRAAELCTCNYITVLNQYSEFETCAVKIETLITETGELLETFKPPIFEDHTGYSMRYFDYRNLRFIYNPYTQIFEQLKLWSDVRLKDREGLNTGLSKIEHSKRLLLFGSNSVEVKPKSIAWLLVNEILHPFYIFQVFSIVLWYFSEYKIFATSTLIISASSIIFEMINLYKNSNMIHKMSKYSCRLPVFRNRTWLESQSEDLVPGDLIDVSTLEGIFSPCDCVLLSGECIVDESMLTGESVPSFKYPIKDYSLLDKELGSSVQNDNITQLFSPELNMSFVYSGTKFIRIKNTNVTKALVVRTGFSTIKGSLIRSILFPKPHLFKFYQDSLRFIMVLSVVAVFGFAYSIYVSVKQDIEIFKIITKSLDIITVVVPPSLTATMTAAIGFSLFRLKKKHLYCVSPQRINECGKINYLCFDKTGTLTEDGLDVLGVQVKSLNVFSKILSTFKELSTIENTSNVLKMEYLLASCHCLKIMKNKLIGDPMDIKMFEFTKCSIEESGSCYEHSSSVQSYLSAQDIPGSETTLIRSQPSTEGKDSHFEIKILRVFDFIAGLRRMSVLVELSTCGSGSGFFLYAKGAPETISKLCISGTLPNDYQKQLLEYANQGYRVIACAGKAFYGNTSDVYKIKRNEAEKDLEFLGFIVFDNKLKPQTKLAINMARDARIDVSMCTGDNLITSVSVAKQCDIINTSDTIYYPNINEVSVSYKYISWKPLGESTAQLDNFSLFSMSHNENFCLAIDGETYKHIMENESLSVQQQVLIKTKVFARMSPDEKQHLVEQLQSIKYCVCFCGDGANDCGALKAANVGVSLSDAEASAAAPFTSKVHNIECVFHLIKEGRAALVSSFGCFKYMGLYSIIQFFSLLILYTYGSILSDNQFLFIDLFLIIPLSLSMGRNKAYHKIAIKEPPSALVSKKVLTSFLGQCAIQIIFQSVTFLFLANQEWFLAPQIDPEEDNYKNSLNTVLFYLTSFQYIIMSFVFSVGIPYRKSLLSNYLFLAIFIVLLTFCGVLTICTIDPLDELFGLVGAGIPLSFRYLVFGICVLNCFVSWVYEKIVVDHFVDLINRITFTFKRSKARRTSQAGLVENNNNSAYFTDGDHYQSIKARMKTKKQV